MTTVLIPDLDAELRKFTPLEKYGQSLPIGPAPKTDTQRVDDSYLNDVKVHPAADLFPMMDEQDFAELKADIEQHGQREPIVYWHGQLLDGRNRLRACRELEIQPSERELDEKYDPVAFVLSANLHRRHLTTAQRAMIAAKIKGDQKKLAKERQKQGKENLPDPATAGQARDKAGELLKVSGRTVDKAEKILKHGSDFLIDQVERGHISVNKAEKIVERSEAHKAVKRPHVAHNSGDNEWYTPKQYIAAARAVMGGIDLDPCGCIESNRVVEAESFHTRRNDGLQQAWNGRVWMNPPFAQPLIARFTNKLVESINAGNVTQACVLVNNATETKWFRQLAHDAAAICFLAGRVRFWNPRKRSAAPLQGQAVLYFGPNVAGFVETFRTLGIVYGAKLGGGDDD